MTPATTFLAVSAAAIVVFVLAGVRIDREYQRGVIFRLGRFHAIKGPGLYWIIPFVDQKVRVDLRTRMARSGRSRGASW